MRARIARWWHAAEPTPPLSWQEVLALGGGVALSLELLAGILGGLQRKDTAAVAFGATIAVLGQLGPVVTGLGASRRYVATASLALVVVCALGAVVGDAEVRRLQTGGLDQ